MFFYLLNFVINSKIYKWICIKINDISQAIMKEELYESTTKNDFN